MANLVNPIASLSSKNKFLIVKSGVVLTDVIDPVIAGLDPYFERYNLKAYVTSGLRVAQEQLSIIRDYLVRYGLDKTYYNTIVCNLEDKYEDQVHGEIYSWQLGWSALLHNGIIISPPIDAECLLDYIKDGVNKKGSVIHSSPHMRGTAFDIGGGSDGADNESFVVREALVLKLSGLAGYIIERKNNCCHCDCKQIK